MNEDNSRAELACKLGGPGDFVLPMAGSIRTYDDCVDHQTTSMTRCAPVTAVRLQCRA